MSGTTYTVGIQLIADGSGFRAVFQTANGEVRSVDASIGQLGKTAGTSSKQLQELGSSAAAAGKQAGTLGALEEAVEDVGEAAQKSEKQVDGLAKSSDKAGRELTEMGQAAQVAGSKAGSLQALETEASQIARASAGAAQQLRQIAVAAGSSDALAGSSLRNIQQGTEDVGLGSLLAQIQIQAMFGAAQTGAEQVRPPVDALGSAIEAVKSGLVGLLALFTSGLLVQQGIQMADAWGQVGARLGNAVTQSVDLANAQERVFQVAQDTRSAYGETAALAGTLARSMREAGTESQAAFEQAAELAATINQTIQLSGATAESSAAGVQQLNQGLAAGALRGDELNSVIEQTPRLAQALADGLGVGVGALRQLGEEGLLTRERIITALQGQADVIAAEYARLPATVGGAFTQLSNSVMKYAGEANQASGYTQTLAGAINALGNNLEVVVGIAEVGLAILIGRLAGASAGFVGAALAARSLALSLGFAVPSMAATAGAALMRLIGGPFGAFVAGATAMYFALEPLAGLIESLSISAFGNTLSGWWFGFDAVSTGAQGTAGALERVAAAQRGLKDGSTSIKEAKQAYADLRTEVLQVASALEEARNRVQVGELFKERAERRGQFFDNAALEESKAKVAELEAQLRQLFQAQSDLKASTDAATAALERQMLAAAEAGKALEGVNGITEQMVAEQERIEKRINSIRFGDAVAREMEIAQKAGTAMTAANNENLTTLQRVFGSTTVRIAEFTAQLQNIKLEGARAELEKLEKARADEAKAATQALQLARREADEQRRLADARAQAHRQVQQAAADLQGPVAAANERYRQALAQLQAQYAQNRIGAADYQLQVENLGAQHERAVRSARAHAAALAERADVTDQVLADLAEEGRLIGMTARERQAEEIVLRAIEQARREANAQQRESIALDSAEVESLRQNVLAQLERNELAQASQRAAGEYRGYWLRSIDGVADAFGDWWARGLKDTKGFIDGVKQSVQRLVSDILSMLARRFILNLAVNSGGSGIGGLLQGVLGGSGAAGTAGLGGLGGMGGSGNVLGSILGIGGGNLATVSGGMSGPFGAISNAALRLTTPTTGFGAGVFGANTGGFGSLAGNAVGAVGGLYGVYNAYKTGSPLSGAVSGAMAGTAIMPGIGTIIGGIVGALAGLFGGPSTPDLRLGGQGVTRKPEVSFTTAFGQMQAGVRGGTDERQFIELVTKFDAELAGIVGSFQNGSEQLAAVQARLATWSVDLKGSAITAEAVLGSRFAALLSTFDADIQAFVGSVGDVATRTQRLADAAFIDAAQKADGLLPTFNALASVLTDYRVEGEQIAATYQRVVGATILYEEALALAGITIEGTRETLVRTAVDVAEAAGGLEQAQALWGTFFSEFYSDQERAQQQLTQAQDARRKELADIGLAADISNQAFREAFLAALPTLSPEQVVEWLQASTAIAGANQAQAAYNDTLAEAEQQNQAAREALAAVLGQVDDFARSLDDGFEQLRRSGLTELQRELLEVNDDLQSNVAALQRMRSAAVEAGASASELARIDLLLGRAHRLAAEQAAAAIERIRSAGRSLVSQLYGDGNSSVGNAAQQLADQGVAAFGEIGDAASQVYESQLSALKSIQEWLDAQRLGDLSTLTPAQRFDEAQSQFAATLAAAQGGDAEALRRITSMADALLREGRNRFASGQAYTDLEAMVRAALQGLVAQGAATPGQPGGGGAANGPGTAFGGALQGATQEFGQQAQQNRLELAQQLAGIVAELMVATGDSLQTVSASLGLNLTSLVTDLGVNLDTLTGATTTNLAAIAASLGVELADLAQNVGVDLGALATEQSLLNDALEAEIQALPEAQRDKLQGLLDAVEAAADDPEGLRDAREALVDEIERIGGSTRDKLAPYFDEIDPTDPLYDIRDELIGGFGGVVGAINALQQSLAPPPPPPEPPGSPGGPGNPNLPPFAAGTSFVPQDMAAQIHQGEMIIDPASASALRRYGIRVAAAAGGGTDVAAAIRSIGERLESRLAAVETAVRKGAHQTASAVAESVSELLDQAEFTAARGGSSRSSS